MSKKKYLGIYSLCFFFMFEFPCIISLYYIKNQQDATLAVLFISNCKITLQGRLSSAVDNRAWTSLLDIHHPEPWHAPVAATTVLGRLSTAPCDSLLGSDVVQ